MEASKDMHEKGEKPTTKYVFTCSTVMLSFLTSSARALVHVAKNALVPEYVASIGEGMAPANDPMLRIKPRFLRYLFEH